MKWMDDGDRVAHAGITADEASDAVFALQDLLEAQTRLKG